MSPYSENDIYVDNERSNTEKGSKNGYRYMLFPSYNETFFMEQND